jgi:potassium-transporting ATPase KdpC subunit
MVQHIRANLWLLLFSIGLSAVVYPLLVLAFGQTLFPDKSDGSLLYDKAGNVIGSSLIAQPFSGDEYFHPRPSAVSYNAAGTAGSNWAPNNYLLRDRVARMLGPIAKYNSGEKKDQLVGPDIEAWFQKDQYQGAAGIVAQWATLHSGVASNWVKSDPLYAGYVAKWQESHPQEVVEWKKANPDNAQLKPEDLAVVFFVSFSKENPGAFPVAVEIKTPEGTTDKVVQPVKEGTDIQSMFFDMWRQEHPTVDLQKVPSDMVLASGAGLDPDITLKNAMYQLDRVASKWAADTKLPEPDVRSTIERLLKAKTTLPLSGLAGVPLVNVLEVNLALNDQYRSQVVSAK